MPRFSIYLKQKAPFCFGSDKSGAKRGYMPQVEMDWCKKVGQYFKNATWVVMFGLYWKWTGAKYSFMPRLKIELRP